MKAFNQPTNQIDLFTGFSIQANCNKLEIISKIRCVYLCAQKHLPIFAYPDLVSLVDINLKNQTELVYENELQTLELPFFGPKKATSGFNVSESSLSNYAEYTNPVSGATFLHAIALVIEESVLEETRKSSAWSLLIDENNTIIYDKTCAIVSKHIANNIPVFRYFGLIELKEVDAAGIIYNLNNFFLVKMLDPLKLLHFRSDALAGKDSAKDVPYFLDYEVTIKELYAYFANSHSRWQNLQLIQAQDDESSELAILQNIHTVNNSTKTFVHLTPTPLNFQNSEYKNTVSKIMDLKYGLICLYPELARFSSYEEAKEWLVSEGCSQISNNSTDITLDDHSIDDINDDTESESSFDSNVTDESPSFDNKFMQDFGESNNDDILSNKMADSVQTGNGDSLNDEHRDKPGVWKSTQQNSVEATKVINVNPSTFRIGLRSVRTFSNLRSKAVKPVKIEANKPYEERKYICPDPLCKAKFAKSCHLKAHREVHAKGFFPCSFEDCGKIFFTRRDACNHFLLDHDEWENQT
ncbi:14539_t:CDS:2 [Dentiscutata erythropus]|uniref:14539_t:CDS:1 n=1 Tax=Dentiscutata erythropus TaxID=1348616 RepID=A0A9N9FN08_9GLOM|nr:14539_t:CDS:2 [Dentiscutata erythropus]